MERDESEFSAFADELDLLVAVVNLVPAEMYCFSLSDAGEGVEEEEPFLAAVAYRGEDGAEFVVGIV